MEFLACLEWLGSRQLGLSLGCKKGNCMAGGRLLYQALIENEKLNKMASKRRTEANSFLHPDALLLHEPGAMSEERVCLLSACPGLKRMNIWHLAGSSCRISSAPLVPLGPIFVKLPFGKGTCLKPAFKHTCYCAGIGGGKGYFHYHSSCGWGRKDPSQIHRQVTFSLPMPLE